MAKQTPIDIHRFAAWAGIIGPILFVAVFTIEGFLRPDYNPINTYISDLSIGPRGIVQIVNFIVFGALLFIFAQGITSEFRRSGMSLMGPRLLSLIAILLFLSGPFVTDPINTPFFEMTWQSMVHNILGAAFFLLGPISCYVFWRTFRDNSEWTSFQKPTLVMTVILSLVLVIFTVSQKSGQLEPNALMEYAGLMQRIDIITFLLWIISFAWSYRARLNTSSDIPIEM